MKKDTNRGLASADPQTRKEVSSKGGKAAAQGDTSNRGFASMDPKKQREIASEGGRHSHDNDDAFRSRIAQSTRDNLDDLEKDYMPKESRLDRVKRVFHNIDDQFKRDNEE